VRKLLAAHYGQMRQSLDTAGVDYTVVRSGQHLVLRRDGGHAGTASDPGALLFLLDQDLIIQLQNRRRDLYFVHAAALDAAGKGFMLVASSGGGKSTTAWALTHHGVRYLSDELGVVDLATLNVHPYPRALLLKNAPPSPYILTPARVSTSRGLLVTGEMMSGGIGRMRVPLQAVFLLRYAARPSEPSLRTISAAEAGARLYPHVLNALAHPADGLDAAIHIAQSVACFELAVGDLGRSCALVTSALADMDGARLAR
jgi:hypothetical protein